MMRTSSLYLWLIPFVLLTTRLQAGENLTHYAATVVVGSNGKPFLALTNYSTSSITGFIATVDLSNGRGLAECRIYYDSVIDSLSAPAIVPGHTIHFPLGYVVGQDYSKLAPRVRAVVLYDGTTYGEAAWTRIILRRRHRLYQRLSSVREVLLSHVFTDGSAISSANDLALQKADAHASLPDDDLRIVDDLALDSAVATMNAVAGTNESRAISHYIRLTEERMGKLKESMPKNSGLMLWDTPASNSAESETPNNSVSMRITPATLRESLRHGHDQFSLRLGAPILDDTFECYVDEFTGSTAKVVQVLDNCGPSQLWDLSAQIVNTDQTTGKVTSATFDAGDYKAFGACWAQYTDCSGNVHSSGEYPGKQHFEKSDNGTFTKFFWELDNWSAPSQSACGECDPDPNGIVFASPVDNVGASAIFSFTDHPSSAGCTVSP